MLATPFSISASISADGSRLVLTDTTGVAGRDLTVVDGARRSAARDLGLSGVAAAGAEGSQTISGRRLLAGINSRLASSLNGGAGVGEGTFDVTRRDGSGFSVSVGADDSIADIIGKINAAGAGRPRPGNRRGRAVSAARRLPAGCGTSRPNH